ncbi:MAG: hypothetical protein AB7S26_28985 [Sandaracinaceae bacterium]
MLDKTIRSCTPASHAQALAQERECFLRQRDALTAEFRPSRRLHVPLKQLDDDLPDRLVFLSCALPKSSIDIHRNVDGSRSHLGPVGALPSRALLLPVP